MDYSLQDLERAAGLRGNAAPTTPGPLMTYDRARAIAEARVPGASAAEVASRDSASTDDVRAAARREAVVSELAVHICREFRDNEEKLRVAAMAVVYGRFLFVQRQRPMRFVLRSSRRKVQVLQAFVDAGRM